MAGRNDGDGWGRLAMILGLAGCPGLSAVPVMASWTQELAAMPSSAPAPRPVPLSGTKRPHRQPVDKGAPESDQARQHNKVNEIADTDDPPDGESITASQGPNWLDPAHDAAGNTCLPPAGRQVTLMPRPGDETAGFRCTYDLPAPGR